MTEEIPINASEPIFQELLVKIIGSSRFHIPAAIVNQYSICGSRLGEKADALHCELVELWDKKQEKTKIGQEVLIDVSEDRGRNKLSGEFQLATCNIYELWRYEYALLKLIKLVRPKKKR